MPQGDPRSDSPHGGASHRHFPSKKTSVSPSSLGKRSREMSTEGPAVSVKCGVWDWEYEHGTFEVNIVAGGEFVCESYPAHAHWTDIPPNKLYIDWGEFGTYDMVLETEIKMAGSYSGYPDDWRKATWKREHTAEESRVFAEAAAHAHSHEHEHEHEHHHH